MFPYHRDPRMLDGFTNHVPLEYGLIKREGKRFGGVIIHPPQRTQIGPRAFHQETLDETLQAREPITCLQGGPSPTCADWQALAKKNRGTLARLCTIQCE
jgi:hypothetical protein